VRRRSALLAVPAFLLTAAGCGNGGGKGGSATASPTATATGAPPTTPAAPGTTGTPTAQIVSGPLPDITAGRGFGQKPTVAKGTVAPSPDLAVRTVVQGKGTAVAGGDYVQVNYLGQIWQSGKVFDSSFDRGPFTTVIGQGQVIPGWDEGLLGRRAGSRLEMAVPPALGYGSSGNPQAGISGTDTLVFVIDVLNSFNGRSSATGKAVPQNDPNLPKVGTGTDGKQPSVDLPKGAKPPTKLVANYVLEGDGPAVKAGDTVLAQYQGLVWAGGKPFDSSYSHGELASLELDQLIPGWKQGLVGKKTGSRVLLVTPPALGYGKTPPSGSGIPADATLVFTLDILAVL
jgi:peptidylprolyl isomerase